jgi:hypothetical protein
MHLIPASFAAIVVGSNVVGLLLTILIACLLIWGLFWIVGQMGLPPVPALIARVIIGILAIIYLLNLMGLVGGEPLVIKG